MRLRFAFVFGPHLLPEVVNVFLTELLVVYTVSALVVFAFHRFRVPSVVGLLVSGVLVGPHGLKLVSDLEDVHLLAETGVVVLLFTVGLEFSLGRLLAMSRLMLQIGAPQVLGCAAVSVAATWWYLGSLNSAIFAGMLVAMSSTAVVFKLLADRGEMESPHGRIAVAVLLFQDLLVVVCMLMIPLLADGAGNVVGALGSLLLGLATVAGILIAGRTLIPGLLHQIVRTRNRELFLIAIFVVCIGTATLTAWAGLSLALGAFLAGLLLAESEYGHQTLAEVLPFRDTLSSLFFVSVGMLLDVRFMLANLALVVLTVLALVVLKFVCVALPTKLLGYPLRTAWLAGLALAQVGEFSFVLAVRGLEAELLEPGDYQIFLSAAVLTMGLTPFLINSGARTWSWLQTWWGEEAVKQAEAAQLADQAGHPHLQDHVVIAGYGLNGRNLARVLNETGIEYVVLEMNPETVRQRRKTGEHVLYGDCTRTAVLEHAGIGSARAYVVVVSDPTSIRQTVALARKLRPDLRIIVRTRFLTEVDELRKLGASEIIPEDFETSVEIFSRVLREYEVPGNVISRLTSQIRAGQYQILRSERLGRDLSPLATDLFATSELETAVLSADSPLAGRTLAESGLRTKTGASIVAVRRGSETHANPPADLPLAAGDTLVLFGSPEQLQAALEVITSKL